MPASEDSSAMASPPNTPTQWTDLAAEIKETILGNLSREDLKACRMVDRDTENVATSVLFRRVCLGPSAASVARVKYLSTNTQLSKMVRCLEVHRYGLRRLPNLDKFFDGCPELAGIDRTAAPPGLAVKILARYNDFREEVIKEREFARDRSEALDTLTDAMKGIIGGFSRLDKVIYTDDYTQNTFGLYQPGADRGFYQKIGATELDPRKCMISWPWLTQSLASTRLMELELRSIHWRALGPTSTQDANFACFQSLRRLTLTFNTLVREDDSLNVQPTGLTYYTRPLTDLSRYVPKLEELSFGFRDMDGPALEQHPDLMPMEPLEDDILELLSSAILAGRYECLTAVSFSSIFATEKEVVAFAVAHQNTLRKLTVNGFRQSRASSKPQGVFDGLLQLSQGLKNLELEQVTLEGPWIDTRGPVLTFEPSNGFALVRQIEQYICRRGSFPRSAFEMLINKFLRGERRAEGNDLIYETSGMRLRVTVFTGHGNTRYYLYPSSGFAHAMRHALEMLKAM